MRETYEKRLWRAHLPLYYPRASRRVPTAKLHHGAHRVPLAPWPARGRLSARAAPFPPRSRGDSALAEITLGPPDRGDAGRNRGGGPPPRPRDPRRRIGSASRARARRHPPEARRRGGRRRRPAAAFPRARRSVRALGFLAFLLPSDGAPRAPRAPPRGGFRFPRRARSSPRPPADILRVPVPPPSLFLVSV